MDNSIDNTEAGMETPAIKPNSPTLLIDNVGSRFSDALWYSKILTEKVLLAGLGGIGSWTALLLSRLRLSSLVLYDDDRVDASNMSGQLYRTDDIGNLKAISINTILRSFSGYYNVYTCASRFSQTCLPYPVMICGFDNMESRKIFYNKWKEGLTRNTDVKDMLFIDGRLAAEEFQIFCIKGTDKYHMTEYEEKWLFDDAEAEETVCSYKQTTHCASMIASYIVNLFVNFVANKCEPLVERDLPFLTYYNASTMYMKTLV